MKKHFRIISALVLSLCMICNFSVFAEEGISIGGGEKSEVQYEDLMVAYDNNKHEIDIESVDKDSYDGYIFRLKEGLSTSSLKSVEKKANKINDEEKVEKIFGETIYSADSLETIKQVADADMIECIEPDYKQTLFAYKTNDTYYSKNERAFTTMNVQPVWEKGFTGKGKSGTPTVGVIDSGVAGFNSSNYSRPRHNDLNYDNIPSQWRALRYSLPYDENGHGTFVIGEIAAIANNGLGVNGIVPDVTIIPGKAFDSKGGGYTSDSISILNNYVYDDDIDVVNMSFGSESYESSFQTAINAATRKGMILVAAAGNDYDTTMNYPAGYNNVIGVAATDEYGNHASYSNHNSSVDVCAPGTFYGINFSGSNSYREMSGTYMATPIITACAAMAKTLDSSINYSRFLDILISTSKDLGSSGWDSYYGYGMVDFQKVYSELSCKKHSFEWVVVKKANVYEDGLRECRCKKCGEVKDSEVIPQIGSVELSKDAYKYTGKTIKPTLNVYDCYGDKISSSYYTKKISKTAKNVGSYVMTVKFKGRYEGTEKLEFVINPAGTNLSKLTKGTESCKVAWKKKTTQVTGYQIEYSQDPSFEDSLIKTVSKNKTTSVTIKELESGCKYYFRIRTYKTVGGEKYYSSWSSKKSVTVK